MAANPAALRDPYPPPPAYYTLFAPDNDGAKPLPPPPPPIPTQDALADQLSKGRPLKLLGNTFKLDEEIVPPLNTQALYKQRPDGSIDFKGELRRLSSELLFMLLELLRSVVEQPDAYSAQLTTVNVLFSNLIHLTNTMRPLQARATLEATLRAQVDMYRTGLARVRAQVAAADQVLSGFAQALAECEGEAGDTAQSSRLPVMAALDGAA